MEALTKKRINIKKRIDSSVRQRNGLFGDRGTWTLTISKIDGFSSYYKLHCCQYWHVEWDSIFILVQWLNSSKDLSDSGVNDLSLYSSIWIDSQEFFHFSYNKYRFESSLIIWYFIVFQYAYLIYVYYIGLSFTLSEVSRERFLYQRKTINSIC